MGVPILHKDRLSTGETEEHEENHRSAQLLRLGPFFGSGCKKEQHPPSLHQAERVLLPGVRRRSPPSSSLVHEGLGEVSRCRVGADAAVLTLVERVDGLDVFFGQCDVQCTPVLGDAGLRD